MLASVWWLAEDCACVDGARADTAFADSALADSACADRKATDGADHMQVSKSGAVAGQQREQEARCTAPDAGRRDDASMLN